MKKRSQILVERFLFPLESHRERSVAMGMLFVEMKRISEGYKVLKVSYSSQVGRINSSQECLNNVYQIRYTDRGLLKGLQKKKRKRTYMHSVEEYIQKAPVVNSKYKTKTSQTGNKINKSSNVSVWFAIYQACTVPRLHSVIQTEKDQH